MTDGALSGVVAIRRARLQELPTLVLLVVGKVLEHDSGHHRGSRLRRVVQGARVFAGAWGEMLSTDVWTDTSHDAVVCETPERFKAGLLLAATAVSVVGFVPFVMISHRSQLIVAGVMTVLVSALAPTLMRERRRSRRHRSGAAVLTFLASRRPGAGRALLEARCRAADAKHQWLCLDAPVQLEDYYRKSGFERVGDPEAAPGRTLIYMERAPGDSP